MRDYRDTVEPPEDDDPLEGLGLGRSRFLWDDEDEDEDARERREAQVTENLWWEL